MVSRVTISGSNHPQRCFPTLAKMVGSLSIAHKAPEFHETTGNHPGYNNKNQSYRPHMVVLLGIPLVLGLCHVSPNCSYKPLSPVKMLVIIYIYTYIIYTYDIF